MGIMRKKYDLRGRGQLYLQRCSGMSPSYPRGQTRQWQGECHAGECKWRTDPVVHAVLFKTVHDMSPKALLCVASH